MKEFKVVDKYSGYINKKDITNVGTTFLTTPSVNTYINDGEKVMSRQGYTLFGPASATETPVEFADTWVNSRDIEIPFRSFGDKLQFYYYGQYIDLLTGLTSASFNWDSWWDDSEKLDLAVFVNGTPDLYAWNGAVARVDSVTSNTITLKGTATWAENRFFTTGNKTVVINGDEYDYTGGEGTTTLTGVTPNPLSAGVAENDIVFQKVVITTNTPDTGVNNDIIITSKNQIYIADKKQRLVYISTALDYTDFSTMSVPRLVGEAEILTLDATPNAFISQEESVYISAGKDQWYQVLFTTSSDLQSETLSVDRLKTGPLTASLGQKSTAKVRNDIVFVTAEKTVDSLGRTMNVEKPQSVPLSDSIQNLLINLDITSQPIVKYWRRQIFISFPSSSVVLIYDLQRGYWQPPWIMGINAFSIYQGELYGHSSRVAETYKMFDGYNDNDASYNCVACFSYRNYGKRPNKKTFDEYYIEGYISSNTILNQQIQFDYDGYSGNTFKTIDGSDTSILNSVQDDNSLGSNPLGEYPLGDLLENNDQLPKFRVCHTHKSVDFYEYRPIYSSNVKDARWELLAEGPNARYSKNDNNDIKR